jgi:hypothetical protein
MRQELKVLEAGPIRITFSLVMVGNVLSYAFRKYRLTVFEHDSR